MEKMVAYNISNLIVLDDDNVVGITIHDVLK